MIIINQDRDKSFILQKKTQLNIGLNVYENTLIGYNIYIDKELLGTYDTYTELFTEISNILNCKYDYYICNGFTDYLDCFKEVKDV